MDKVQKIDLNPSSKVNVSNQKKTQQKSIDIKFDAGKDSSVQSTENKDIDLSLSELNTVEDKVDDLNDNVKNLSNPVAKKSSKNDSRTIAELSESVSNLEFELKHMLKEKEELSSGSLDRNIQFTKSTLAMYKSFGDNEKIIEYTVKLQRLEEQKQRSKRIDKVISKLQEELQKDKLILNDKQFEVLSPDKKYDKNKPLKDKLQSNDVTEIMTAIHDETLTEQINPKTGKKMSMVDIAQAYHAFVKDGSNPSTFAVSYGLKVSEITNEELENLGIAKSDNVRLKIGDYIITQDTSDESHNAPLRIFDLQGGSDANLDSKVVTLQPVDNGDGEESLVVTDFEQRTTNGGKTSRTSLRFEHDEDLTSAGQHHKILPQRSKVTGDVIIDAGKNPKTTSFDSKFVTFEYYYRR